MESSSFGNSSGDSCSCLSFYKPLFGLSVNILFRVFGFFSNTRSYGLLPLAVAAVLKANRRHDKPAVPLCKMIVLSALSRSFKVLIRRSIFQFPRWSRIGHSTCFMKWSAQNCLNFLLRNFVAGSVLILFGIPNTATYVFKNYYFIGRWFSEKFTVWPICFMVY